jgi:DtxR family transcriptional regulator, Mn-dependent transcriptional regulator
MTSKEPTETIARYLEALFYIEAEGEVARGARLADWLSVSRPTVTMALRRMSRDGLVRATKHEIALTKLGRAEAAAVVRKHRLMERWLTDVLGFDWVAADQEAARLEHAVSDAVVERLFEVLGHPTTCPHGNPIPGYGVADSAEVRLGTMSLSAVARVSRVSEVAEREAPALLAYLQERGLVPGAELVISEIDTVGRTLRFEVRGAEFVLSRETADKVWVVPSAPKIDNPPLRSPGRAD